jgi:hypothetical protein
MPMYSLVVLQVDHFSRHQAHMDSRIVTKATPNSTHSPQSPANVLPLHHVNLTVLPCCTGLLYCLVVLQVDHFSRYQAPMDSDDEDDVGDQQQQQQMDASGSGECADPSGFAGLLCGMRKMKLLMCPACT